MNTLKSYVKWIICLVITILIFTCGIPLAAYNFYAVEFSIFGGFLVGLFLIFLLSSIDEEKENTTGEDEESWGSAITIGVFVMFVCGFLFYGIFHSKLEKELKNGYKTQGIVINTMHESERRWSFRKNIPVRARAYNSYTAVVMFETKEGKQIVVEKRLSLDEYHSFRQGDAINLVYSRRNAKMVELLTNVDAIRTYKGVRDNTIQ
jgi:hypothetical protein